ncbi:hypothetical protein ACQEU3_03535 [Spirillospora sp. CA-253888]
MLLVQAHAFDPSLLGDPQGTARLRAALDTLAQNGHVTFPAEGSRTGWDRRSSPPLPLWVLRSTAPPPGRPKPAPRVWPHLLEAAGRVATRQDEYDLLERIACWLRDDHERVPVPAQERSIELFGDEKALDRMLSRRLFTSGALSLELLACFQPPLPFVSQHVHGVGPTRLMVLENRATYTSVLTLLRGLPVEGRPDAHVGWGAGEQFSGSVLSASELCPPPQEIVYFGDLDLAGLRIAATAAAVATAAGLPGVRPAASCYSALLRHQADRPDRSNKGNGLDYALLCEWLPEPLRAPAQELLIRRVRLPQELLGLKALLSDPALLLTDLT